MSLAFQFLDCFLRQLVSTKLWSISLLPLILMSMSYFLRILLMQKVTVLHIMLFRDMLLHTNKININKVLHDSVLQTISLIWMNIQPQFQMMGMIREFPFNIFSVK